MRAPILAMILTSIPALAAADELSEKLAPVAAAPEASATAQAAPATDARQEDPNIDRMFLLPSAETQPAGSVSFNDYELLLMGVTYGVTDDLQITGTALAPIVEDMPVIVNATAKYRLVKSGPVRFALQAGVGYGRVELFDDDEGDSNDGVFAFQGGALVSLCLDGTECRSMASASVTAVTGMGEGEGTAFIYGAGVTAKVAKHAKLLFEATSAAGVENGNFSNAEGAVVSYGVRFHSNEIAADVGFMKPVGDNGDDDFLLGIPFINLTYRP
jgi:hypothetical protein